MSREAFITTIQEAIDRALQSDDPAMNARGRFLDQVAISFVDFWIDEAPRHGPIDAHILASDFVGIIVSAAVEIIDQGMPKDRMMQFADTALVAAAMDCRRAFAQPRDLTGLIVTALSAQKHLENTAVTAGAQQ